MSANLVGMGELMMERKEIQKEYKEAINTFVDTGCRLALVENEYKVERTKMIAQLNVVGMPHEGKHTKPLAITACEGISHGIEPVASLRLRRDMLVIEHEVAKEKIWAVKTRQKQLDSDIESIRRTTGI